MNTSISMQQFRDFVIASNPAFDWPEWLMPGAEAYGIDRTPISQEWYVYGPVPVKIHAEVSGEGCVAYFDMSRNGWRQTRTADRCFRTREEAETAAEKKRAHELLAALRNAGQNLGN